MAVKQKRPRKVEDWEISEYQGFGGKEQMLKAQSRKRRQVRRQESSMWDGLAPKEYHGLLTVIYIVVFVVGLLIVASLNGHF